MKLNNEAKAIKWTGRLGGEIEMPYVGTVLAHVGDTRAHPFAVWSMTSEDGIAWDCYHGNYCETLTEAEEAFESRRI